MSSRPVSTICKSKASQPARERQILHDSTCYEALSKFKEKGRKGSFQGLGLRREKLFNVY